MHQRPHVWLLVIVFILQNLIGFSTEAIQTGSEIIIKNGQVATSGVLADDKGSIFIEFLAKQRVSTAKDKRAYDGAILPPLIIEAPVVAPQARMREVLTFELITNDNESINFIDRYAMMSEKERLRLSLSGEQQARETGMLLLTRIFASDGINDPAIWRLVDPTNPDRKARWRRLGGTLENSNEPDVTIFSVTLFANGIYTIWDENPPPVSEPYWTNPDDVELALPSPIESVSPRPIPISTNNTESRSNNSKTDSVVPETQIYEVPAVDPDFSFSNTSNTDLIIESQIEIPAVAPIPKNNLIPNPIQVPENNSNLNPLQESLNSVNKASLNGQSSVNNFSNEFLSSVEEKTEFIDLQTNNLGPTLPVAGQNDRWGFPWALFIFIVTLGLSGWALASSRYW